MAKFTFDAKDLLSHIFRMFGLSISTIQFNIDVGALVIGYDASLENQVHIKRARDNMLSSFLFGGRKA